MYLKHLSLQNFRNYAKSQFKFSKNTTLIVGPNTAGKSNLIEAIFFVSSGKSFRVDQDEQLIKFEKQVARIKAKIDDKDLEAIIAQKGVDGRFTPFKKYLVNGVSKKKVDFVGNFFAVLFAPSDLEIIIGSPSKRRDFIDNILNSTDREYRLALTFYEKGLRARNALLHRVQETGIKNEKEFAYWDNLLIVQGQKITKKREDFIEYLTNSKKEIFDFEITYDKSIISKERLLQYKEAEIGAGVTLVGPHRDNLEFIIYNSEVKTSIELKDFGSRGQQRLTILQLKILELLYVEQKIGEKPVLLLDDIFSELDEEHINLVLKHTLLHQGFGGQRQTIITTTHKEFVENKLLKAMDVIELTR